MNQHTCHAIGCETTVPPARFMCFKHWRLLPNRWKQELLAHYRPGQEVDRQPSREYLRVANECKRQVKLIESNHALENYPFYPNP